MDIQKANHVAYSLLCAIGTGLNFFWAFVIAKEVSPAVKDFLTVSTAVGPLSGLFLYATLVFAAVWILLYGTYLAAGERYVAFFARTHFWYFSLSIILFFFLVFPPIFLPIVRFLSS